MTDTILNTARTANGKAVPYSRLLWWAAPPTALLVLCTNLWWDVPIANRLRGWLMGLHHHVHHIIQVPDLLLPLVVAVTLVAWFARFLYDRGRLRGLQRDYLTAMGVVAPLAYVAKSALKFVFGRIDTRVWLRHPHPLAFHWFHGGGALNGFPSGHMVVCCALGAVFCRLYPAARLPCALLLALLAAALLLLEYHFLSDVLAGAYFGLVLENAVTRWLLRRHEW